MRTILSILLCLLLVGPMMAQDDTAPDSTGLPGDNFSLQGALDLFKNANDLEQFEQALNTEDNKVNNLDLDGDGQIDYVRVTSHKEGDAVAVVLQVPVSKGEAQDVAVIEMEKTGEENVMLQILGDDELYPAGTIIEPFEDKPDVKEGKGPSAPELLVTHAVVNVWAWSGPRWCYSGRYYPWVSPWFYGSYPPWWKPWRPHPWHVWGGWHRHHGWYRPWNVCRVQHANALYGPRRSHSAVVHARYADAHGRHLHARPARSDAAKPVNKADGQHIRQAGKTPRTSAPKGDGKGRPNATRPARGGKKGR